jgi:hypothetical protein
MAEGMFDPVAGLIDPKTYQDISQQWNTFLSDPKGRAAMLQTGIAMSQPLAWGQSNFGALTGALGSGGEAVGRVEAMDLKQQEAESKAQLRDAQSMMAETRARESGAKSDIAAERLRNQQDALKLKAWSDLRKGYETYRKNVEAENSNILRTAPPTPVLPIDEWIRTQPSARAAAEASGLFGTTGTTQPGTFAEPSAPSGAAPTSGGGVVTVQTPDEAQRLRPGTRYRNPQGQEFTR